MQDPGWSPHRDGPPDSTSGAARRLRARVARVTPAALQEPGARRWVGLALLFLAMGVFVLVMSGSPVVLVLAAAPFAAALGTRLNKGITAVPAPAPSVAAPPSPEPAALRLAWSDARAWFTDLRAEYAAHECDPMAVLRLPALSDVSVPSTARFVDAFAEAQALDTLACPPPAHAAAYVTAVEHADRTWRAARDAAERIRLSGLTPDDRSAVERVIKLLTTARDSDSEAERQVAYARARAELARLDRAGVIRMPRTAQAALDVAGRGQLPA